MACLPHPIPPQIRQTPSDLGREPIETRGRTISTWAQIRIFISTLHSPPPNSVQFGIWGRTGGGNYATTSLNNASNRATSPSTCKPQRRAFGNYFLRLVSDSTSKSFARGIRLKVCNSSGVGWASWRVVKLRITPSTSRLTAFFPLALRIS